MSDLTRSTEMQVDKCEYCGAENSPVFKIYRRQNKTRCICQTCYIKFHEKSFFSFHRIDAEPIQFQKVAGETVYFVSCIRCGKLTKDFRSFDHFPTISLPPFIHFCHYCAKEMREEHRKMSA